MAKKMEAAIRQIALNRATFENTGTTIVPTYINFFFGRNGAGKSTLAEVIAADEGIVWRDGDSHAGYDVLVYNQEFIDRNFSSYGDLAGVITIHEQNIEIQQQLDRKRKEKAGAEAVGKQFRKDLDDKKAARDAAIAQFQKMCWSQAAQIREAFKEALKGKLKSQQFMDGVLSTPAAVDHDYDELKSLYDIAFSLDSRPYHIFGKIDSASTYGTLPGRELLDKAIVSSSGSSFSQFIKALNATDWVRQGHDHYAAHTSGKCPYCQQALPAGFEDEIAACFDAQYQQDIADLREFEAIYKKETAAILEKLTGNMQDVLPTVDLGEYRDKLALLESKIKINIQRIESKIKEPTSIVALEDTDSILLDLGQIIDEINRQIMTNNSIVNDKRKKQEQCKREVWEMIAFLLKDQIADYKAAVAGFDRDIKGLEESVAKARADWRRIMGEIQELNKQGVNTEEAIESINHLLRDSGFQGFELKPKQGVKDTYEVIRPNGEVATRLSEGERNFIAFLYFYQLVRGNGKVGSATTYGSLEGAPEGADTRDKIVVIDDPVSSMDSNALFIVSSIVRGMIGVCYNNTDYRNPDVKGDYIKQIFIMTHNAYFHNEITYKEVSHYKSTSFFVIRKVDNKSTIIPCVRPSRIAGEEENYNPVQNSYAALWDELKKLYKEERASIAIKNVSRRIIDQYFLQLCGFEGADIRRIVLEENKGKFVTEVEGGKPNYEKYHLASALLHYVSRPSGIGDEMFIDDECVDSDTHRTVFQLIFEVMHQDQHYNMMMGNE
ncbi:MAG: AAA family ATPase [Faecousia sp.]